MQVWSIDSLVLNRLSTDKTVVGTNDFAKREGVSQSAVSESFHRLADHGIIVISMETLPPWANRPPKIEAHKVPDWKDKLVTALSSTSRD